MRMARFRDGADGARGRTRAAAPYVGLGLWAGGAALLVALVAREGWDEVVAATAAAGWGVLAVVVAHLVPLACDALAWSTLINRRERPNLVRSMRNRWIGEAVGALLPSFMVGGEIARVRIAHLDGVRGVVAGASTTVDVTLGVMTQVAFSVVGLIALVFLVAPADHALVAPIALGTALFAASVAALFLVLNAGVFRFLAERIARVAGGEWPAFVGGAHRLDRMIFRLYRARRALILSAAWRMAGWLTGVGEIWLALAVLGHRPSLVEAVMLESLIQAVRTAAFPIPGALGIQEGGLVVLCATVGIGAETALALALLRRLREWAFGIPGLVLWNLLESRRLGR
jgi:putative membrane protein